MIVCLNEIIELLSTMLCVNYLFSTKYVLKIYDMFFIGTEFSILIAANMLQWAKEVTVVGYLGIYIYQLLAFKCKLRKASMNIVLIAIFCTFSQVIGSVPVFMLSEWVSMDILVMVTNLIVLVGFVFLGKKGYFYRISIRLSESQLLGKVAIAICFVGAGYLLIVYKLEEYLRITDYFIFGFWTILIFLVILQWQKEKVAKITSEHELELRTSYDVVYEKMLHSMRKKQHDFHNQIMAVYSHHFIAKDYETLVSMQKEYCDQILNDNRYARLLSGNSPMVIAFLYSKFIEAESKGCVIQHRIIIDKLNCQIPQYKIVEVLGILLDNAIEAVENQKTKNIDVEIIERQDIVLFLIKNDSNNYSEEECEKFMLKGYSKKGKDRGIGLDKVSEMLQNVGSNLNLCCKKENQKFRMIIEFKIMK